MSLDLTTLRILKRRKHYDELAPAIPERALDAHTREIVKDFGRYFREFPEVQLIEPSPFLLWFRMVRPKLNDEAFGVISEVIKRTAADVEDGVAEGLMARLHAAHTANEIADLLTAWNEGAEINLAAALRERTEDLEFKLQIKHKNPQDLTPIEDILAEDESDFGFKFRLECLNQHVKPLVPGDFVIVAAPPGKGKSTFCASELTHMAAQVDTIYPGENRSILWLNNEGPSKRIVGRCFQAALGATMEEMAALVKQQPTEQPERFKNLLRQRYAESLGGRPGVLRIMSVHDYWNNQIEDIMRKHKPAIVLFDMIDNVKFGGATLNNGERTDQVLEAMYQWARMLAVKYEAVMIATSQISAEGQGMQFPAQRMLKDSKTGKQGAADLMIMLGAVDDPALARSRYISIAKTKKNRTGVPDSPNKEILADFDRGRFREYLSK